MGEPKLKEGSRYTKEEYLAMEAESHEKLEFYDGTIRAMSGGTRNHASICAHCVNALINAIDNGPCATFGSELKVYSASANAYFYPDALVVCGDEQLQEGRDDVLLNPTLILEVLSPSTMSYDFVQKFDRYKRIPSLQEYVLVSQDQPRVEVRAATNNWGHIRTYEGLDATATFSSLNLQIPLTHFYRRVSFQ